MYVLMNKIYICLTVGWLRNFCDTKFRKISPLLWEISRNFAKCFQNIDEISYREFCDPI
jgi:hypothetical protein